MIISKNVRVLFISKRSIGVLRPIRVGDRIVRVIGPKQSGVVIRHEEHGPSNSHYVKWDNGRKSWVANLFVVREK